MAPLVHAIVKKITKGAFYLWVFILDLKNEDSWMKRHSINTHYDLKTKQAIALIIKIRTAVLWGEHSKQRTVMDTSLPDIIEVCAIITTLWCGMRAQSILILQKKLTNKCI